MCLVDDGNDVGNNGNDSGCHMTQVLKNRLSTNLTALPTSLLLSASAQHLDDLHIFLTQPGQSSCPCLPTVGRGTTLTMTNTMAASLTIYNKHNTTSSLTGRAFSSFLEPNLYSPLLEMGTLHH